MKQRSKKTKTICIHLSWRFFGCQEAADALLRAAKDGTLEAALIKESWGWLGEKLLFQPSSI